MLKVMKLAPHYVKIDANLIKNIDSVILTSLSQVYLLFEDLLYHLLL